MTFIYGVEGVIGFMNNGISYLYRKNLFGDVTEIYNETRELVGKYSYTAFGECTIEVDEQGIATKNPIRYRSYYYDEEINLYYLKTRYYDPEIGRFMTIDDIQYISADTINGLNLYAYCANNPVMRTDSQGRNWWTDFWNGVGNWFKELGSLINERIIQPINNLFTNLVNSITNFSLDLFSNLNVFTPNLNLTINNQNYFGKGQRGKAGFVEIDPNAPGRGDNGEFTVFQKIMAVICGIGLLVAVVGVIISFTPFAAAGVPLFIIGTLIAGLAATLGGFGHFDGDI